MSQRVTAPPDSRTAPEPPRRAAGLGGIHGRDDRVEICQTPVRVQTWARNVVAAVKADNLAAGSGGSYYLTGKTLEAVLQGGFGNIPVDPAERFLNQTAAAFGSGFFVARNYVVTAEHVLLETSMDKLRFITGFVADGLGRSELSFLPDQVYKVAEVVRRPPYGSGSDFAVLRVTNGREGPALPPLPVTGRESVAVGTPLSIIGHPCGIPAKYAANARVVKTEPVHYIGTNIDAFGGNSGSPVFDESSGEVVGILVRTKPGFAVQGGYVRSVSYDDNDSDSDVQRIQEVFGKIHSLRLSLRIGPSGISGRQLLVHLKGNGPAFRVDLGGTPPKAFLEYKLDPGVLGVTAMDDIDVLCLESPPSDGKIQDDWTLSSVKVAVNRLTFFERTGVFDFPDVCGTVARNKWPISHVQP